MNKYLKSLLAVSLIAPVFSVSAATFNAGNFYVTPDNPAGDYSNDRSGVFWDELRYYTRGYGLNYRDRVTMTISGSHTGLYNDELLLVDLNSGRTWDLDEDFSVTINTGSNYYGRHNRLAFAGAGLNATDATILSNYSFSMEAGYIKTPTPVPLPATAWLFVSGLMGLATYRRKRSAA
jgi:hypothetical protein